MAANGASCGTPKTRTTQKNLPQFHEEVLGVSQWSGDPEKTSLNQVIFSECGRVFKKGIGWDGNPGWMIFDRREDIFQWVFTEMEPRVRSLTMNIQFLRWNIQCTERYNGDEPGDPDKVFTRIKMFSGLWNGSWSLVPFQWDLYSTDDGVKMTSGECLQEKPFTPQDNDYDFYKGAYHLSELPIYNSIGKEWEDQEGWTHYPEQGEVEENIQYDSYEEEEQPEQPEQQEQDVPEENLSQEDLLRRKEEAEERARGLFQVVEVREDPFDGNYYTKQEFLDYYGTTIQWDFVSEEKLFKRSILGQWIIHNGSYMRPESVNYLLDKMIETFL